MFKVKILLLLIAAVAIHGRPEGDPKKMESKREGKSHSVSSATVDSASLPDLKNKDVNNFKRAAKEAHSFLNGGEIPVQLVYDPKDQETIAEVKEIKPIGYKLDIRKRQSRSSNSFTEEDDSELTKNKKDSTLLGLLKLSKYLTKYSNKGEPNKLTFNGMYDIDLDLFNKNLGIEARQHKEENVDSNEYYISTDAETYDIDNPIAMYIKQLTGAAEQNSNGYSIQNIKEVIQHYQPIQPSFGLMNHEFLPRLRAEIMKRVIADSILSLRDYDAFSQVPLIASPFRTTNVFQSYLPLLSTKNKGFVELGGPPGSKSSFLSIIEYEPEEVETRKRRSRSKRSPRQAGDTTTAVPTPVGSGPQIMRLKVRRGGVAIAGPGGIATAGSGGTAIVGPGGTAYTSSDGIAVVGPGGKLIHVPGSGYKSTPVVKARDGSVRLKQVSPATIVATGPVVYYPKNKRF